MLIGINLNPEIFLAIESRTGKGYHYPHYAVIGCVRHRLGGRPR